LTNFAFISTKTKRTFP